MNFNQDPLRIHCCWTAEKFMCHFMLANKKMAQNDDGNGNQLFFTLIPVDTWAAINSRHQISAIVGPNKP